MEAQSLVRQGRLDEALAALQGEVRARPADAPLRVFMFQLLSVMGQWDRALTQLNVAAELDGKNLLTAMICRPALQAEALRAEIFGGRRTPLVFGRPPEWVALMIQAAELTARGEHAGAGAARASALEAAPAIPGDIDGRPFQWIQDADPRLGPIVEAVIDGRYYWVPFINIASIRTEPPSTLRDAVWAEAQFTWINGGSAPGLIPVRYPGSESADDPALRLARRTDWLQPAGGVSLGLGQRLWATDAEDAPALDARVITLRHADAQGAAGDA